MIDRRSTVLGYSASFLFAAVVATSGCSDEGTDTGGNSGGPTDASADGALREGGGGSSGGGTGGASSGGAGGAGGASAGSGGGAGTVPDASGAGGSADAGQDDGSGGAAGSFDFDAPVGDGNPYVLPTCSPTAVTSPLISDFTYTPGTNTSSISWGNYFSTFSGYSYFYPDPFGTPPGMLMSDIQSSAWRISGVVNNYAGFGLGFACKSDASMYTGISFTVRGTLGGPLPPSEAGADGDGGGDAGLRDGGPRDGGGDARDAAVTDGGAAIRLTMGVSSAPTEVATTTGAGSWGTCIPRTNQYDGTCVTPSVTIDVTPAGRTYRLRWSDFTGGAARGADGGAVPQGIDPAQLIRIYWTLPWTPGTTPLYPVDITIDDVTFTTDDSDAASPADAQRDGASAIDARAD